MQAIARTKIPYFVATTNAAKQPPRLPIESNIPIALIRIYQAYLVEKKFEKVLYDPLS